MKNQGVITVKLPLLFKKSHSTLRAKQAKSCVLQHKIFSLNRKPNSTIYPSSESSRWNNFQIILEMIKSWLQKTGFNHRNKTVKISQPSHQWKLLRIYRNKTEKASSLKARAWSFELRIDSNIFWTKTWIKLILKQEMIQINFETRGLLLEKTKFKIYLNISEIFLSAKIQN